MSKKQAFIEYVSRLFGEDHVQNGDIPDDAWDYWKGLIAEKSTEKPLFTDNGKVVLKFFQEHQDVPSWKTKDVAEGIGLSSRSVSGSLRKLVADEYIDKIGKDPILYCLTEKGKNAKIEGDNL